ncbi:hypothetical protein KIH86_23855 [Paenibacillus sp. HN-1]|uniref:hypothetical protein n=1 Tax=Paenibacillus TaxID=44249 RepID=UPI001CA9BAF7|nr:MULTISPECIES: hypothetical protein [Paenibacillus]MBY9081187.1 hypothetical protein [Paenibacillus sp. CGMCC 1.18879]MBY9087224.1 hypothetical protein [Paenibacillus sinensis]
MHFKLKDSNGNIISPFLNEDDKPVVELNGKEYEILEPSYDDNNGTGAMAELIADFDSDPEIQQMIAESEQAIEKGQVYTTQQVIEMINNGEI